MLPDKSQMFKDNRIYPFHVMYDTGILEELKDIIVSRGNRTGARVGGLSDLWDQLLERMARRPGRALWREMKFGARKGFENHNAGVQTQQAFAADLGKGPGFKYKLHLVGHSTGGILLAHLLEALKKVAPLLRINTCSLLAPAATMELFGPHYHPLLTGKANDFGIDQMTVCSCGDADKEARTLSTVHGGFDNDPATLNDILKRLLGKTPVPEFNKKDLEY